MQNVYLVVVQRQHSEENIEFSLTLCTCVRLLIMLPLALLSLDPILHHTRAINGRLRTGRMLETPKVSMESRRPCRMIWN
jgi:hypothetical protein